jgi:hypothetical protein
MKNIIGYWGVILPDFLKIGNFTEQKALEAETWCKDNCVGHFRGSDLFPWVFQQEKDSISFQKRFGGLIKYKPTDK